MLTGETVLFIGSAAQDDDVVVAGSLIYGVSSRALVSFLAVTMLPDPLVVLREE
jgi:hypothetical protein